MATKQERILTISFENRNGSAAPEASPGAVRRISVVTALETSRWSLYQKAILALTALAVVFDGLDNQLLGFAAPALIRDWGISKADLVPIIASSLIAMTVGTSIAGFVADRFGRRPTLIASVALFGLASAAIAIAPNLAILFALRLVAAVGLGAAMPIATALLAEFTPLRNRAFGVTLGIVCIPLGGLLGGLLSANILPDHGWRALFLIGGLLPLVVVVAFLFFLPESPQLMLARGGDPAAVRKTLARCGIELDPDAQLVAETNTASAGQSGLSALFAGGLARETLLLWVSFFTCLLAVYSVFNWAPTLLAERGLDLRIASTGLAGFNFGGIAGAIIGAWMIDRYGSRGPLVTLSAIAVITALSATFRPLNADTSEVYLIGLFSLLGFCINGVQTTLFAVAATTYPTTVRATGVGMALGVGRLGAVLSSAAGAAAIAAGGGAYFVMLGAAMAGAMIGLLLFRGHIRARVPQQLGT